MRCFQLAALARHAGLTGSSLAVMIGTTAAADVTYSFSQTIFSSQQFTQVFAPGTITTSISSVSFDLYYDNMSWSGPTNFGIYMNQQSYNSSDPFPNGHVLIGANSVGWQEFWNPAQHYDLPTFTTWGAWEDFTLRTTGTIQLSSAIDMTLPFSKVWIGNFDGSGTSGGTDPGRWWGSITLHTVPAPGAVAMLGLVGFASRRRRERRY